MCEYVKPVKFAQVEIREEAHGSFATEVNEKAIRKKILNYFFFFVRIRQPLHENRILLVNLLLRKCPSGKKSEPPHLLIIMTDDSTIRNLTV